MPDRVPCFPPVDVVYAGSRGCHSVAQIQLDPELHSEALSRCVQELPIDGVYVNLCLGKQQTARVEHGDGRHRVPIDVCLVRIVPATGEDRDRDDDGRLSRPLGLDERHPAGAGEDAAVAGLARAGGGYSRAPRLARWEYWASSTDMGWGAWWIQNSYGFSYAATLFLSEPWFSTLQCSWDLFWDNQGGDIRKQFDKVRREMLPDDCR